MRDAEHLVERLQSIEADLRDLAYDRLRAAAEDGDADALADEKKVLQARRAIERAIVALGGAPELRLTAPSARSARCVISAMRRRHLLLGDVLDVAGHVPPVPARVLELARAVAVELVLDRARDGGAGVDRLGEHRVGVGDVDVDGDRRAADRLGDRNPWSGNSSASMTRPVPISSSAWPMVSGESPGMRMRSLAPNTRV